MTRTKNGNLLVIKSRGVIETVCFIILNYNGFGETKQLVDSIRVWNRELLDFHVIVVDNCSPDGSYEKLRTEFAHSDVVDVICSEKNGGYSYGNNFGARYAMEKYNPQYIAISNPDVEIGQDTVIKLLDTFSIDTRIAMCAPVMKSVDGSFSIHAIKLPTYSDDLRACVLNRSAKNLIKEKYQTLESDRTMIVTEMLPGSFFVIRSDCFEQVGMFDEEVFLYCEERILGKRIKDAGFLAVTRADLFFIHAHAVTIRRNTSIVKSWKILLKSRYYYEKCYQKCNIFQLAVLKIAMNAFLWQIWAVLMIERLKKK